MISKKIKKINDAFNSFPDSMMGLHYLIDLGRKSQREFPDELRTENNFIHGCTSYAWLVIDNKDPIKINTVSDSLIVSGILYLLEMVFNDEPKSSIVNYDVQQLIDDLGLKGSITMQRLRGFGEAVRMMKEC